MIPDKPLILPEITEYEEKIRVYRAAIFKEKPVIHHITNFVTIYQCARITAFLGAAPIMAFAPEETTQITAKADALVVNTGTLNNTVMASIPKSLEYAGSHHIPVVLDPVGASLSSYRSDFIRFLLNTFHFDVIRCNGAELLNLHGQAALSRGIDGASSSVEIPKVARDLAQKYDCVMACTGARDYICSKDESIVLDRGSELLPTLVGTGCMVNSLIGAYLAVAKSPMAAAACGILTMCLASERAAQSLEKLTQGEKESKSPISPGQKRRCLGSFETALMDAVSEIYTS
ncbi:hydroxyethylthiazole kinase [Catenibacillus scindens]|uniref:Hydroxyethylthiazole kinase n=1 Tax=Catenibacillus scindens TaxID=673271 RepID=A0A7W8HCS7_9FIRM|nr:hydroxyethylthiazole kinase [Catenibacillus scindens]MBB5265954.1 hydroxyethylthiazole kinase [Catenibacillus scindens]